VDDALAINHDGEAALKELDYYFQMKSGSIGDPDIYLGAKLRQFTLENGVMPGVCVRPSMCKRLLAMWRSTSRRPVTCKGS
jgi:hypothetical protein